jgi:type III pantothenate kinase
MLLAVDIGNTNTVIGVFDGETLSKKFRLNTNLSDTSDEISLKISTLLKEHGIQKEAVNQAAVCSVVPQITGHYIELAENLFGVKPVVVGPGVKPGISILYDNPKEVGADRIANAVGGYRLFGGPLIIVDLGTAITFDAVSAKGEYLGGVIAPGVGSSMASLSKKAAQLPHIGFKKPGRVIGRNTVESMQSGAVYGFAGMIDAIVRKMKSEMEGEPKVIATGGQSEWLKDLAETVEHHQPDLTLHGLFSIHALQGK